VRWALLEVGPGWLPDSLYAPDITGGQSHLDTVRVVAGLGKDVLHHAFRENPGSLVFLENNTNSATRFDVGSFGRHAKVLF
jgi:hypothetical protein